ncbi:uncharacterized protein C11orf24 homolog [Tenrec ecaudatus]|uniref:uncharacterized protein C11orf24 homolog n=1 Tax=Tenrec ecaudatus TaxID=94439 RepID=UPI003F5AD68E
MAQPRSQLAPKMRTALVLSWVFCLHFPEIQMVSTSAGLPAANQTWPHPRSNSTPPGTTAGFENKTSAPVALATTSPVSLTSSALASDANLTTAKIRGRTEVDGAASKPQPTKLADSSAPLGPTSSVPMSLSRTLPTVATQHPAASMPRTQVPGTTTGAPPALSAAAVATATPGPSHPVPTLSPPRPPAGHSATDLPPATSPQPPNTTTQGPTTQTSTGPPVANPTSRPPSTILSDTVPEPTTVPSVPTTAAATSKAQTEASTASTAPAPQGSPTPKAEATSPTAQMLPDLTPSTRAALGQVTPQHPERVGTEAMPSTAPADCGDASWPAGAPGLLVTAAPLAPSLSFLLAVLLLGVTLFVTVLVLFALQAYESYQKKDYTQVDYLINGMYADSEM